MSAPEFDEFAALWTQEPDAEEQRIFQSLARAVSRRAKLIYYIELGLALFLGLGVLLILLLDRRPATTALVILVIAALGWSSWKRYNLQQVAMIVSGSDRESLLASAVTSAEARLRHSSWSLVLLAPSFFLGLALRGTIGPGFDLFVAELGRMLAEPTIAGGAVAILLLYVYFGRQNVILRRELRRLKSLQAQYRQEAALDAAGDPLE